MFDPNSRYHALPNRSYVLPDGRIVAYKQRRLVPSSAGVAIAAQLRIGGGERPDTIAARVLGDPEQFWRLADVNDVIFPDELAEVGRIVRVPLTYR